MNGGHGTSLLSHPLGIKIRHRQILIERIQLDQIDPIQYNLLHPKGIRPYLCHKNDIGIEVAYFIICERALVSAAALTSLSSCCAHCEFLCFHQLRYCPCLIGIGIIVH